MSYAILKDGEYMVFSAGILLVPARDLPPTLFPSLEAAEAAVNSTVQYGCNLAKNYARSFSKGELQRHAAMWCDGYEIEEIINEHSYRSTSVEGRQDVGNVGADQATEQRTQN